MRTAALSLGIAALVLSALPAGGQENKKDPKKSDAAITYGKKIAPILKDRCEPCHYPKDAKGKLDVSSYKSLMKGGKSKDFIVAGDPDKSLLIKEIIGKDPPMPKNANPLTTEQIDLIKSWIKEGAKNN